MKHNSSSTDVTEQAHQALTLRAKQKDCIKINLIHMITRMKKNYTTKKDYVFPKIFVVLPKKR
jgi:hypothetical protein